MRSMRLLALIAIVAGIAAHSAALPPAWADVRDGPAGGAVYQGWIPNGFAPWDHRLSAIYLPPGFTATKRYPVIYLLPGMPGSPSSYWDGLRLATVADELISSGAAKSFIAVMPAGGPVVHRDQGEWAGIWESYLVRDVVPWVDAHLPTVPGPGGRALEGLSAGGYGAVDIGLRHPGIFGTLGSWGGYFAPVFADGPFVHASRAYLAAHDPTKLVRAEAARLRAAGVRFYVSTGGNHGGVRRRWSIEFARELASLRLPHELWLLPPAQQGHFWGATVPSALEYAAAAFDGRNAGTTPA